MEKGKYILFIHSCNEHQKRIIPTMKNTLHLQMMRELTSLRDTFFLLLFWLIVILWLKVSGSCVCVWWIVLIQRIKLNFMESNKWWAFNPQKWIYRIRNHPLAFQSLKWITLFTTNLYWLYIHSTRVRQHFIHSIILRFIYKFIFLCEFQYNCHVGVCAS
jgi:hypothetical protein